MRSKFLLCLLLSGLLYFGLSKKWGSVPPLLPLFSPFEGFWQQAEQQSKAGQTWNLTHGDLKSRVSISFDSLLIPHVYASHQADVYWAQGYVTASQRLWQMEFQTRAAAGKISEIVGPLALDFDKHQRKIGMTYAAEKAAAAMLANDTTRLLVENYCNGVNGWIESLSPKDLPVEYKILNYKPEKWTPLQCALLLKYMAYDLTANRSTDLENTKLIQTLGFDVWQAWFPEDYEQPVIPTGTKWSGEAINQVVDSSIFSSMQHAMQLMTTPAGKKTSNVEEQASELGIGSNNWAVHGSKTASGSPILANDPHLSLNLPSLWFFIHLSAPGLEVMGASLPGAPGVIIGFNKNIAWGVTNAYYDVLDWYAIDWVDDSKMQYHLDGKTVDVDERVEYIKVAGGETVVEKVKYTHFGPVPYMIGEKPFKPFIPTNCAMKWMAHLPSNELKTFTMLNKANDLIDYQNAISTYSCPAQNFAFASREGDIAICANGKVVQKQPFQGQFVLDGSTTDFDWKQFLPFQHIPCAANPSQGFVSSANQRATDSTFPYLIYGEYATPERAIRINELLKGNKKITPATMQAIQNDVMDVHARKVLPSLLQAVDRSFLNEEEKLLLKKLSQWNLLYAPKEVGPSLISNWWKQMSKLAFSDETGDSLPYPSKKVMNAMVFQPQHPLWDNIKTEEKETLTQIATQAWKANIAELTERHQKWNDATRNWAWGSAKGTFLQHVARLDGFGTSELFMGGGPTMVNATSKRHGPSLKIVVATGDHPEAYAIIPGGQSGNPGSRHYDNFVENWRQGNLMKLSFPTR